MIDPLATKISGVVTECYEVTTSTSLNGYIFFGQLDTWLFAIEVFAMPVNKPP